jgi:hypothetical protein
LRNDGDALRVVVRLIDGTSDAQLWSQHFDRKSSDLLAVQQEIALAAVKQILPQVDPNELPRPVVPASVTDLMLLARNYQQKAVSPEDWDKVVSMYQAGNRPRPGVSARACATRAGVAVSRQRCGRRRTPGAPGR